MVSLERYDAGLYGAKGCWSSWCRMMLISWYGMMLISLDPDMTGSDVITPLSNIH